jgi:cytochrome c553
LARHFAALKPKPFIRVIRGDIATGRAHYATRCASCHGVRGEGKREIESPPVNLQEDWFLLDQLRKYANGQRGVHPSNAGGLMMKAAAAALSPDDLRNIVAYIAKDLTVTSPLQKVAPPKP